MVKSTKKKNRGKQRKQKQADAKDRDNFVVDVDPRFKSFAKNVVSQPPAKVVEAVQLGMLPQTAGVARVSDYTCLRRLIEAGLLDVVFGFFRECGNVSIATMLPFDNVKRGQSLLVAPRTVLCLRISSIPELKDLRMTIVNGIQPLFKCLRDDHKRELFKSRRDWLEGTSMVVNLLNHLLMSGDEDIETCIFNHEGVSELLIRSFFWKSHRPDIMDELTELEQASSLPPGSRVPNTALILQLLNVYASRKEEMKLNHGERKDKLYDMAATSIVNKRHDKQCNTNFIVGLLQRLKTDDEFKSDSIRRRSNLLLWHLVAAGSVDKEVIKEVCDFGSTNVFTKGDALLQTTMCFVMLNPASGESVHPNVNHYVYGISCGCFEMLIDLLLKYSFDGSVESEHMITNMESIFDNASSIMSERRVAKAMLDRKEKINESLVPLERKINQGNGRSVTLMRIVRGIRSMVDGRTDVDLPFNYGKGYLCQTCGASLDANSVRRCGKCKQAIYCSRECQVKDWQSHRSACSYFSKGNNNKKWKDVEQHQENISNTFLKLFMNNIANLLMQAIVMDWNIVDCTVLADTKKALPSIRLVPSNMITWHDSVENKAYYKTVKQYHLVGNLVGLIRARDIYTVGFPPVVLGGEKTWTQAQAELKSSMTDNNLDLIKTCSEARKKMCGQMFCDWYDEYKATAAVDRVVL